MTKLLEVRDLIVEFSTPGGLARAVDRVSFSLNKGETLGIVGESGCGKTVTAFSILRLIQPPGRISGGEVLFEGKDLLKLSENEMRKVRGSDISMIFQEPMSALNPVFTIGNQIVEAIRVHTDIGKKDAWEKAAGLLAKVGIPSPEKRITDYPHQLSGGMRQRAMIAMALSCNPKLLIADEPTTALDVTIQAQILDLMVEMKDGLDASVLLITHDLGVVAQTCDHVVVIYAGRVVESATVEALFAKPAHPYTQGLLGSIPARHETKERLTEIEGMVPGLLDLPTGCSFHPRCPEAMDRCRTESPELAPVDSKTSTACWLYKKESVEKSV